MTKKALLIGINYPGTSSELNGCANDIKQMYEKLLINGYKNENICIISDDWPEQAQFTPSKRNIVNQLTRMIDNATENDQLFLHYSGHGTYTWDRLHSDEADRRDEAICPASGGNISDDELNNILKRLTPGAKMFCLFDCCHSGSVLDLLHNLDRKETTRLTEAQHGYAVMISGCQDKQLSADAFIKEKYQGAMTAAFLEVESKRGFSSILKDCFSRSKPKMRKIRDEMLTYLQTNGFDQIPNVAYEGLLAPQPAPAVEPQAAGSEVLEGFGLGGYFLRRVASRIENAINYLTVQQPEDHTVRNSPRL